MKTANKFMNIRFCSLLFICAVLTFSVNAQVSVKASLDSAFIIMGEQTNLHIETVIDKNKPAHIFLPEKKLTDEVEIIDILKSDTVALNTTRLQIRQDIVIQSFDSGMYTLPPIRVISGTDTFRSNELTLKVIPVAVDTTKYIADFKPQLEPKKEILDFLPDYVVDYWWIVLLLLAVALDAYLYYADWKDRKKGIKRVVKAPYVPPYKLAMNKLATLKESKLAESGQDKEYYTQLTDILREYIDRRFQIKAMEMTSSQIVNILHDNNETKAVNQQLKMILDMADFVKFANIRPMSDDNELSYKRAIDFVEQTKPLENAQVNEISKSEDGELKINN